MKNQAKHLVKRFVLSFLRAGNGTRLGNFLSRQILSAVMEEVRQVEYRGLQFKFAAPNSLCDWRAKTFSTKEPETLEWIESIPEGASLWDVGANIGLYSVYAAKRRNCSVWAFEPSIFNLELLARNIFMNGLTERVCIVPVALSDQLGASLMHMTTTEWGGALSTFGRDFGWDGKPIQQVFAFRTIGLSMLDARDKIGIPQPDYIKMDVDGLEHLILKGSGEVLRGIKGLLIEVNDDFEEQASQCRLLLESAGLALKEKRHSEIIGRSENGFQHCYNQIWVRP